MSNGVGEAKVFKVNSGEDKTIEIPLDFIPKTGEYSIKNDDKKRTLFGVKKGQVTSEDPSKYNFVSRKDTEKKSITITIKDVTSEDAGYISTGTISNRNGPGVVLVVTGSPTKPTITGKAKVQVGDDATLTCKSKSTSAPSYYKKLPPLTYTWYRNESQIQRQTSNQWRLKVEKRHKYDTIMCMSREEINSVRSKPFNLIPQYGPDTVNISPEIRDHVDVIKGKTFGPYKCSADCNPPCRYQWKRHKSGSQYDDVGTRATFTIQSVDKADANKYRCRVYSEYKNANESTEATRTVTLRVLYLSKPVVYADNGIREKFTFMENVRMNLSCKAEGVPQPSVSILRNRTTLSTGNTWSNFTFSNGLHCEDTGSYKCTGKSSGFNKTEKSFFIDVLCSARLDVASFPRSLYGSQIGQIISVSVPVIANPKPDKAVWRKPANAAHVATETKIIQKGPNAYRHVIESKIHIGKQSDFGIYSLSIGGKQITNITIDAEGPPFHPLNFSGISEMQGQINLTWISSFNGGPEQFFLLKKKINSEWQQIENISDIGQGRQMSFVVEVEAGETYEFMLQSCNRINCSGNITSHPIKAKEIPTNMRDTGSSISTAAIAAPLSVVVVIAIALAVLFFKIKTKSRENASKVNPNSPPEVMYATVDKGYVNKATIKEDISVNKTETNDTGQNENMYANTNEAMLITEKAKPEKQDNPEKTKKADKKKKTKKTTSTPKNTRRTVNEDGLIYIDVDFAKTPQKTQDPPVIHGEEDRTEYTFVDFSKKAPPLEDTSSDEQIVEKKDDD